MATFDRQDTFIHLTPNYIKIDKISSQWNHGSVIWARSIRRLGVFMGGFIIKLIPFYVNVTNNTLAHDESGLSGNLRWSRTL